MASETNYTLFKVDFLGILLLLFIVLKLTGVIDWSWWIVLLPLWINIALFLVALGIVGIGAVIVLLTIWWKER